MKIIALTAENVKKLSAVEIRPDGNLIQITGKNGNGKSSVLDSIWWALQGATAIQAEPIRQGADRARIRLDLGELIVTRTFTRKDDGSGYTTKLSVETTEGAKFGQPQRVIDELIGKLAFDPLEFARMKPREQFDALRTFVPGVDFEAIDRENAAVYARRTEVNRLAKQLRDAAALIDVPAELEGGEAPDVSDLQRQLAQAAEHNSGIEARKAKRATVAQTVQRLRDDGNAKAEEAQDLRARADQLEAQSGELLAQAEAEQKRLASAPALPPPIDTAAILEQIEQVQGQAKQLERLAEKRRQNAQAEQLEATSAELTAAMEKRNAEKVAAIEAASLPVEGISFGEGCVLLGGVPFEQASDAQRLMASTAIAMAMNPKLRVLRIRDGSLLDSDSLALLEDMLQEHDYQAWVEVVDSSGTVGFTLEDGALTKIDGKPVGQTEPPAIPAQRARKTQPPKPTAPTPTALAPGDDDL